MSEVGGLRMRGREESLGSELRGGGVGVTEMPGPVRDLTCEGFYTVVEMPQGFRPRLSLRSAHPSACESLHKL